MALHQQQQIHTTNTNLTIPTILTKSVSNM